MPLDGAVGEYRARAGSLTLGYLNSTLGWDALRATLAEAATGADLIDPDTLVALDEEDTLIDLFADRYLIEPANPDDDPDDIETPMQPTPAGREAPLVGATCFHWLELCPSGPVAAGEHSGEVLWPLLSGWAATIVHAVAAGPRSTAEIQEAVGVLALELVDRGLHILADAELLRTLPPERPGGEERFEPSEWLRRAAAPLAASARLELRHPREDTAPLAAADIEAILRLSFPLLDMPDTSDGSCALRIELGDDVVGSPVELTARIEQGRVAACEPGTDPQADAALTGSAADLLDAVIDDEVGAISSEGDRRLAHGLIGGLHEALFG